VKPADTLVILYQGNDPNSYDRHGAVKHHSADCQRYWIFR
jgi:hypothetical protein